MTASPPYSKYSGPNYQKVFSVPFPFTKHCLNKTSVRGGNEKNISVSVWALSHMTAFNFLFFIWQVPHREIFKFPLHERLFFYITVSKFAGDSETHWNCYFQVKNVLVGEQAWWWKMGVWDESSHCCITQQSFQKWMHYIFYYFYRWDLLRCHM